jgi:ribosome-associated protein
MNDEALSDEFKSKSQKKREMHALQALGARLVDLSPATLARMDLPEALAEAVLACKTLKSHGAKRRQLQYIGALMRDVDPAPILAFLERGSGGQ